MSSIPNQKGYTRLIRFLTEHPGFAKFLFFPWNHLPFIYRRLTLLEQGLIGVSSLSMHKLDSRKGRISIGGVDETFWYSEIFAVLKRRLAEEIGDKEKDRFIYNLSKEMGWKESDIALSNGRWTPKKFQPIFEDPDLLMHLRNDKELRELFERAALTAVRLILNEGGWGNVKSINLLSDPIIVIMENQQEARYGKPSDRPVCHYITGYLAGFASRMFRCSAESEETVCAACGGDCCIFEIRLSKE